VIEIEINNRQDAHEVDASALASAARHVLTAEGIAAGTISLAVVDDPTIHELNRRYLDHDFATDVLSFPLETDGDSLQGEVVVSADTAAQSAARYGWSTGDELLLYVVHGLLHLVGHDDATDEDRRDMRALEQKYLAEFGLQPRYEDE